ncbi:Phosphatidylinositol 4-phosphate 5-kinase type-1 alpha [Araneus ventricosus]|uniref:Phosphatidylinositol 4-phosphate 5-kinase type-1 alpha n=1 Tax=Araneus ventricosus TaxID=182803 RepID=A0A4Y2TNI2_ARAVE|nr:Phosphatidylinositol 4-phosphate 5-kinase type-1 alpha [Araneus ventricosus]
MSFERNYENLRSKNSPSFRVADNSHHEAECLFQEPKIPLVPVIENIEESGEETGTANDLEKGCEDEVKLSSSKQATNSLRESSFQSLDFKIIWSDALIPDLKPSEEIPYDLKPKADSLILELVRRGIEVSLDQLKEEKQKREAVMTDFSTVEKIVFARTGPNIATRNFCFCIHAPVAFQFFRQLFGISTECFRNSICKEPLCQLDGYSQSGSMYTSYDDRFLLKICQKKEAAFLENFFPCYFSNVTKHPKTLLPKFFGLYGYREGSTHVHFLIMNNLVPIFVNLHEKYDLKGSTYSKRKFEKFQKMKPSNENQENLGPLITLKDLDFLQRWPDGLYLKQKFYSLLMQSVERDCKILQSYEIMDYSLLLGIHVPGDVYWSKCEDQDQDSSTDMYKISKLEAARARKIKNLIGPFEARTSKGCRVHLYLGIIDILQSYTVRKRCEHFFKLVLYSSNTMSVVKPAVYAERFKNFLTQSVFKCIPELISFQKKEKELVQKLLEDFPDDVEMWF